MTVRELRERLAGLPDERLVLVAHDGDLHTAYAHDFMGGGRGATDCNGSWAVDDVKSALVLGIYGDDPS